MWAERKKREVLKKYLLLGVFIQMMFVVITGIVYLLINGNSTSLIQDDHLGMLGSILIPITIGTVFVQIDEAIKAAKDNHAYRRYLVSRLEGNCNTENVCESKETPEKKVRR